MKAMNLKGKRFGDLLVLDRAENDQNRVVWRVKCKCGKIIKVRSIQLLRGDTTACGACKGGSLLNISPCEACYHIDKSLCDESDRIVRGKRAKIYDPKKAKCKLGLEQVKINGVCEKYSKNASNYYLQCAKCMRLFKARGNADCYCADCQDEGRREDNEIIKNMSTQGMLELVEGIFTQTRRDMLASINKTARKSGTDEAIRFKEDAERFLRSEWAKCLSQSEFDSELAIKRVYEEAEKQRAEEERLKAIKEQRRKECQYDINGTARIDSQQGRN